MGIAQNLDLDMARLGDEFLDEDAVIAKAAGRLVLRTLEPLARLIVVPGDPHPLAAAARAGLDHHRIADLARDLHRLVGIRDQAHVTRHGRDIGLLRDLLRGDLVAHRLDGTHGRADEGNALGLQRLGKLGVFRQEAVARMHRLGPGRANSLHHLVDDDIGLVRGRGANMDRLIRHPDMQRMAVGIGIDRDRPDTHFPGGLDDAAGDLAPIGDQDLLEHLTSLLACALRQQKRPRARNAPAVLAVRSWWPAALRGRGAGKAGSAAARVGLAVGGVADSTDRGTARDIAARDGSDTAPGQRAPGELFTQSIAAGRQGREGGCDQYPFLPKHGVLPFLSFPTGRKTRQRQSCSAIGPDWSASRLAAEARDLVADRARQAADHDARGNTATHGRRTDTADSRPDRGAVQIVAQAAGQARHDKNAKRQYLESLHVSRTSSRLLS